MHCGNWNKLDHFGTHREVDFSCFVLFSVMRVTEERYKENQTIQSWTATRMIHACMLKSKGDADATEFLLREILVARCAEQISLYILKWVAFLALAVHFRFVSVTF